MDCLRCQSLIGIRVIHSLKAEKGTVVCSQRIFSIPSRDLSALDLYYSIHVLVTEKTLLGLITVNSKYCPIFCLSEKSSNAEPKCRPPPGQPDTECRPQPA